MFFNHSPPVDRWAVLRNVGEGEGIWRESCSTPSSLTSGKVTVAFYLLWASGVYEAVEGHWDAVSESPREVQRDRDWVGLASEQLQRRKVHGSSWCYPPVMKSVTLGQREITEEGQQWCFLNVLFKRSVERQLQSRHKNLEVWANVEG